MKKHKTHVTKYTIIRADGSIENFTIPSALSAGRQLASIYPFSMVFEHGVVSLHDGRKRRAYWFHQERTAPSYCSGPISIKTEADALSLWRDAIANQGAA
jgi:hypothetical protein